MSAPLYLTWLASTLPPLGALWLLYRLALRGERCYGYNRILLLLAPLVAALWPLLPRPALPLWLNSATTVAPSTGVSVLLPAVQVGQATGPEELAWSVWSVLALLYLAGVGVGLGRLAWQVARLHRLARRLPRTARAGYVLADTRGALPTSSFGRVVFWDDTVALAPAEAAVVLAHEVAHVRQHHTLDRLWLEVWRIVLWPNPFAHLLLPAQRLTHELLADREASAAAGSADAATPYPTLMARLAARQLGGTAYSSLLQPFTFSFTLTRIAMLQNQMPVRRWKQWLALPVLGGLFLVAGRAANAQPVPVSKPALSEAAKKARDEGFIRRLREAMHQDSLRTGGKFEPGTKQQFTVTDVNKPEEVITVSRVKQNQLDGRITKDSVFKEQTDSNIDEPKVYTYVEQMPQLPTGGGVGGIVKQVLDNFTYPAGPHQQGRVFASFTVQADGSVSNTKIVKGLAPAHDAAVLAAIQKLPHFLPGKQSGRAVAVNFTVPVVFEEKP
jgi:TonB family protein